MWHLGTWLWVASVGHISALALFSGHCCTYTLQAKSNRRFLDRFTAIFLGLSEVD